MQKKSHWILKDQVCWPQPKRQKDNQLWNHPKQFNRLVQDWKVLSKATLPATENKLRVLFLLWEFAYSLVSFHVGNTKIRTFSSPSCSFQLCTEENKRVRKWKDSSPHILSGFWNFSARSQEPLIYRAGWSLVPCLHHQWLVAPSIKFNSL